MSSFWAGFAVGGIAFGYIGTMFGQARARALRAWRDFRAAKDAIKGLFTKTIYEWRGAVKVGAIAGLVVIVAGWWVIVHG